MYRNESNFTRQPEGHRNDHEDLEEENIYYFSDVTNGAEGWYSLYCTRSVVIVQNCIIR